MLLLVNWRFLHFTSQATKSQALKPATRELQQARSHSERMDESSRSLRGVGLFLDSGESGSRRRNKSLDPPEPWPIMETDQHSLERLRTEQRAKSCCQPLSQAQRQARDSKGKKCQKGRQSGSPLPQLHHMVHERCWMQAPIELASGKSRRRCAVLGSGSISLANAHVAYCRHDFPSLRRLGRSFAGSPGVSGRRWIIGHWMQPLEGTPSSSFCWLQGSGGN